jgi:hypothetical protein
MTDPALLQLLQHLRERLAFEILIHRSKPRRSHVDRILLPEVLISAQLLHTSCGRAKLCRMREPAEDSVGEYRGDPLYHASLSPDECSKGRRSHGRGSANRGRPHRLTHARLATSADDGVHGSAILMKFGRGM